MRVALVGTFDIANFGDLLFPEIAQARLKGVADVVCYSPLGGPAVWRDARETTDVGLLSEHDVDAVILGGGNLVHASPWNHSHYDVGGIRGYVAYPRLWFGASAAAAARRIPLCWNAPGVPQPFEPAVAALVRDATAVAAYLSVRDRFSARQLANAGVTSRVAIVPDTGLDVWRLWSDDELDRTYQALWDAGRGSVPERSVAVHLNSRYLDEPVPAVARRLDAIARRTEARVILLALAPCHGDDVLALEVGAAMTSEPLVVARPAELRSVAAGIARSCLYLGSSLHGAVTALAFGVPARLVGTGTAMTKFAGFSEQFAAPLSSPSWAAAEAAAVRLVATGPDYAVRECAAPILERHWDRIADAVAHGPTTGPARVAPDVGEKRLETLVPGVLGGLSSALSDLRRQLDTERAAQVAAADAQAATDALVEKLRRTSARERQQRARADRLARQLVIADSPARPAAPSDVRVRTGEPEAAMGTESKRKPKALSVAVVCWDLGHNALGRAHLLADMLSADHDVEIVGSHFPEFGSDVWQPLRDTGIPLRRYPGDRFPKYFETMERMAAELTADVVYVVKPRLPGLGVGFLAKCDAERALVVDCDDLELSFVGATDSVPLGALEALTRHPEFLRPQGRVWTAFCEWGVRFADAVTVSNVPLAARYGGSVVPHARDERVFDADLYDRDESRARLGLNPSDRVVLFAGTPRRHKGIQQVAAALDRIGDPRNRLCVLETRELQEVMPLLAGLDRWVRPVPPQPFSRLPQLLRAADVVCVLQDPASETARWQMPAKITDALAMGVPCLASPTAPVLPLIDEGTVLPAGPENLAEQLEAVLGDPALRADQARRGRELFERRFSYAAVRPQLDSVLREAASGGGTAATDLRSAVSFQRSIFGRPPAAKPAEAAKSGMTASRADASPPPTAGATNARPRPASRRSGDGRMDVVMFWRQNDSGIYGRRQDMLVKYLAASPKVRRIVHFDDAISVPALLTQWRDGRKDRYSQASLVASQTLRRLRGVHPQPKVSAHTFVYQGGRRDPGAALRRAFPPRSDYEAYVADILARNRIGERPVVFWAFPRHYEFPEFVRRFRPDLVVADVVDDTRSWSSDQQRQRLSANYAEILGMSDLVIANCEAVKRAMEEFSPEIHVVPNACEPVSDHTRRLRRPPELRRLRGPVIGYVGNLSSRIDIDLLERMATTRPEWQLVLIGSAHLSREVLGLAQFDNVHLLGVRPYDQLRAYLESFDVAIVPHLDDAMTRVMNPLKVFVYAAAALPVVATAVGNMEEMRRLVRVADDHDDFIRKVEEALPLKGRVPLNPEAISLLDAHSWPRRVEKVLALIDARLAEVGS